MPEKNPDVPAGHSGNAGYPKILLMWQGFWSRLQLNVMRTTHLLLDLPHDPAAVNVKCLPGHMSAGVADEKGHGLSDGLGLFCRRKQFDCRLNGPGGPVKSVRSQDWTVFLFRPQRKADLTKHYCWLNEIPARVSWYGLKLFGSRCRSAGPAHPFCRGTPS